MMSSTFYKNTKKKRQQHDIIHFDYNLDKGLYKISRILNYNVVGINIKFLYDN